MEQHAVLITAAGSSNRMGGELKKEYLLLRNSPLLQISLEVFKSTGLFTWFVITVPPKGIQQAQEVLRSWLKNPEQKALTLFVEGGGTRQESVRKGLAALKPYAPAMVLIHDGARPFIKPETIHAVAEGVKRSGACAPVIPLVDSLKRLHSDGKITEHVDRTAFVGIQTPQGFLYKDILHAHSLAAEDGREYLDDTEIYHRYIGPVETIPGDRSNRKITYREDLPMHTAQPIPRIGFGYDIHRLVEQRPLWIGGVSIPFHRGEDGHSDGDVLIHALIDALLGAAALGDIGTHFPPSDPQYKDISSRILLRLVQKEIQAAGWGIVNLDCTVVLEQPKLYPYWETVRAALAEDLHLAPEAISLKGKTKEAMDASGRGEAVEAYAVVLLEKAAPPVPEF